MTKTKMPVRSKKLRDRTNPENHFGVPNAVYISPGYFRLRKQCDGEQHEKYVHADNYSQLDTERTIWLGEINSGNTPVKNKPNFSLFSEFVNNFICENGYSDEDWSFKTSQLYEIMLRTRILPRFGKMKISKITKQELKDFLLSLAKPHKFTETRKNGTMIKTSKGLALTSVDAYRRMLISIFHCAYQKDLISTNPMNGIRKFKPDSNKIKCFETGELKTMLDLLENEHIILKLAIKLGLEGGLRAAETCGLEWRDIDTNNLTISVDRISQKNPDGSDTKNPKTKSSIRVLKVSPQLISLIKEYRLFSMRTHDTRIDGPKHPASMCVGNQPLFTNSAGKHMSPTSLNLRFMRFLQKHKLTAVTYHALRHTCASLLIASGLDIVTVSKRLGHANPLITMTIYAHALAAQNEKIPDVFTKFYQQKSL